VRNILRSETYIGSWFYGKSQVVNGKQVPVPRDDWVSVPVPSLVERRIWELAQKRLKRRAKKRMALREYLVGGRISCGHCGNSVRGCYGRNKKLKKEYLYYRCTAADGYRPGVTCELPTFHVEAVDRAVWIWVKRMLTDPEALAEGLQAQQGEQERRNAPLHERMTVVDDLLAGNRDQLERLLDLFLTGNFPKEMLVERKARLEGTIAALERERTDLWAHLEKENLTDHQIVTITEFVQHVAAGLEVADEDFEVQRRILEMLDVKVTLAVEDSVRLVYALCLVDSTKLFIQKDKSR
jgi:site-specific DNA recombinase